MARPKSAAQKAKEARIKKLRWRTIVNATGDNKLADKYSRRGNDRIEAELGIKIPTRIPRLIKPKRRGKAVESLFKPYFLKNQDARQDKWGEWSGNKKKLMPKAIRAMAFRINRRAGLKDDSAAYGYAVLYYAFVNNEPIDLWLTRLVPDTDFDGELYLNVSGFGVKK